MIEADKNAFNEYVEAMRLPRNTDEQKAAREAAMQEGLKKAINVPLTTMKIGDSAWDAMLGVAKYGNIASKSDVEVGARSLEVGIWGAYKNVLINMPQIKDEDYKNEVLKLAANIAERAKQKFEEVLKLLAERD